MYEEEMKNEDMYRYDGIVRALMQRAKLEEECWYVRDEGPEAWGGTAEVPAGSYYTHYIPTPWEKHGCRNFPDSYTETPICFWIATSGSGVEYIRENEDGTVTWKRIIG